MADVHSAFGLSEKEAVKRKGKESVIDLHTHILPGIDDGSPDVETSLQMLNRMAAQGVCMICASSHYYVDEQSIDEFCEKRDAAFEKLCQARACPQNNQPQVLPAAEVAFFPGISEKSEVKRLCIKGTNTLLLEMPFCEWNDFQIEEVTSLSLDLGYQIVLVHPERFLFSANNRRLFEKLQELPIGLQINAGSLLRWQSRKTALRLLKEAACPLLGSDAHNFTTRPPNLREGRSVIERKLGAAFWLRMQDNADRLTAYTFAKS